MRHLQRGAALLLAMLILTLVTTLAAGMIWQQWRAVEVEAAERARLQSAWILSGALDWARLILREDRRTGAVDHLGEPWAVPLAEARLSTFLAADREGTVAEEAIEAFLSGSIDDAQARYNLRNVATPDETAAAAELVTLQRLFERAGLPTDLAPRLAASLRDAWLGASEAAPVAPENLSQLSWFGLDPLQIERLRPWVILLPQPATKVNINTAPPEVLAALVDGLDLGTAQRLVETRQRTPFKTLPEAQKQVPQVPLPAGRLAIGSEYFMVRGRLRLGDHVLEEQSLVRRLPNLAVVPMRRERVNLVLSPR
jgi:general secretion pathway protein K